MPILLYYAELSPPSRSVLLTAKILGVELELKNVNLLQKEQLQPDFIKVSLQYFSTFTLISLILDESATYNSINK